MPDRVLIAAHGRDAQRWQGQHRGRWTRVIAVSHPDAMRGVSVDHVDITPMAANHRDVDAVIEIARYCLAQTTGGDAAIHYLSH